MAEIITANDLVSGDVVFRTATGQWSRKVSEAELLADKAAAEAALAAGLADVKANKVVGVEAIDAALQDGVVTPLRFRERIRAFGPTVRSDFRV